MKPDRDQRRKQRKEKRERPPQGGMTPAEQKAWSESTEWINEHADEVLAAAWLIRKQGMTGFVQIDWEGANKTGIPMMGVAFSSSSEMSAALSKAGYPDNVQQPLLRNAAIADKNPNMANVLIVYSNRFTRTVVIGDPVRTLQQVFEADAERYLAKIKGALR